MPAIQVSIIKNVFTPEQKQQIISKLTDTLIEIIGSDTPAVRGVTSCVIVEIEEGNWGIGGKGLTAANVHALI
jgi:4-oxalocrotonate tautomerase